MINSVKWASDKLIGQNYTWTSRIPSDIKPGLYILRHELLALHDAKRSYNGVSQSGAQAFPVCYTVEITGSGTATPAGKTFPGMYAKNDPGIKIDVEAINAPYVSFT
jgi:lytic cellulose monooxygenase (C1-hydroxylating)